ncbi:MAG: riboflavin synthase [Lachnospiraceae bacterium]
MFTGIVEEIGTIRTITRGTASSRICIGGKLIFEDLHLGDSVAVNGVCLTAASIEKESFTADVMHETLTRSNLGRLRMGSQINLERAMPANGRFGGHIVSGHIDDTGMITHIKRDDNAVLYTISAVSNQLKYVIEKGSVAVDGISLTVVGARKSDFTVSVIPHTVKQTILSGKKMGDSVNLEFDILGKYMEKYMERYMERYSESTSGKNSRITPEFLSRFNY